MPSTAELPKILVPVKDSRTILDFQLRAVALTKIFDEVVITVGYRSESVMEYVRKNYALYPIPIRYVFNGEYEKTGPLYSLNLALREIRGEEFVIANRDVVFEPELLSQLTEITPGITLLVSEITPDHRDAVKIKMTGEQITQLGKELPVEQAQGLSIGIMVVKGEEALKTMAETVASLAEEMPDGYWHAALARLARQNLLKGRFYTAAGWYEVDNQIDLAKLGQMKNIVYE